MLKIEGKDLDFELFGYVSLPEVTRASRNYLSTIINGRFIKNFSLNKAIVAGYGSKLMVGRFPIAVLEIKMDPLFSRCKCSSDEAGSPAVEGKRTNRAN